MYDFAIVALLALGTVKVVDFLADNVSPLRAWTSLITFIAAVGVVVALDYSLFRGFGIGIRNDTGTLGTEPVGGAIGAGVHAEHAGHHQRFGFVDREDARVRMR